MEIRNARIDEIDELIAFYDLMCQVLGKQSFQPNGNKGGYPTKDDIVKAIDKSFQYVGIEDDKIVGTFILDDEISSEYRNANWTIEAKDDEIIVVHALRVHPDYSKRGYAKKLMDYSISQAIEKGYKVMRLDVMDGNDKAIEIYKKYGFVTVGKVNITYPDIGYPTPCILMELKLLENNLC